MDLCRKLDEWIQLEESRPKRTRPELLPERVVRHDGGLHQTIEDAQLYEPDMTSREHAAMHLWRDAR